MLQELPKYLRGYHNSSREETVSMAALLLRIKSGNNQPQVAMIPRLLKELVPMDQLKAASENEWKKVLGATLLFFCFFLEELKCLLLFVVPAKKILNFLILLGCKSQQEYNKYITFFNPVIDKTNNDKDLFPT